MIKKIFVFTILILASIIFLILLTGCSSKNIDDLAYVISIGFDVGDEKELKVYFEISTPNNSGSSGASSKDGNSKKSENSTIISVEANSIDNAINLLNSYISKQIDLSHCNIVVFSNTLAEKGLHDYVYTLVNNANIKPSCDMLISTCSIKDFFENSSNTLENYSSNYETLNADITGFTEIVSISDFFSKTNDSFGEPYAILCGLSENDIETLSVSNTEEKNNGSEEKQLALKTLGLAVFKQDKLVGYLSPLETFAHLILINKFKNCTVPIPSPFNDNEFVDIYFTPKSATKVSIQIVDDTPIINVDVYLAGKISSVSDPHNYLDENNLSSLETATNEYLKNVFLQYFDSTSKKYESDIGSLGKYVINKFLTWDDWEKFDWQNKYKNAIFNVNINTTITSSYLLLET